MVKTATQKKQSKEGFCILELLFKPHIFFNKNTDVNKNFIYAGILLLLFNLISLLSQKLIPNVLFSYGNILLAGLIIIPILSFFMYSFLFIFFKAFDSKCKFVISMSKYFVMFFLYTLIGSLLQLIMLLLTPKLSPNLAMFIYFIVIILAVLIGIYIIIALKNIYESNYYKTIVIWLISSLFLLFLTTAFLIIKTIMAYSL